MSEKRRKFVKYYTLNYFGEDIDIIPSKYAYGNRVALQAILHNTGEPYAVLTTNVPAYDRDYPDENCVFLDVNNCPGIDKVLQKAGLISECLGKIQSGYCTYPVHKYLG